MVSPSVLFHALQLYVSRSDSEGRDGLHYVVETILHLLDPLMPEFSASFVGRLIIVFVKKVRNQHIIQVT